MAFKPACNYVVGCIFLWFKLFKICNFSFDALTNYIIESVENGTFQDGRKEDNSTPVYKPKKPLDNANYRSVSILPLFSEVYERPMFNQLPNQTKTF